MARLDAAADPARAIERGFFVERPGRSVESELAARLELRPVSSHLIIGGVGSGKTTLLLMARDRVNQLPETRAIYVDVSEKHDISRMAPGVLVVLAGLLIGELLGENNDKEVRAIRSKFKDWAHGNTWVIGLLSPAGSPLDVGSKSRPEFHEMHAATNRLAQLSAILAKEVHHIVLLFDSLDRITDPTAFAQVVEQDISAIRWAGIGVVLAGPLRALYGTDRPVTDRFDYFYYQPAIDIQEDTSGLEFLIKVLRAREPADFLPDDVCHRLAEFSGGVLRDLIALAQLAAEEAYLDGADSVAISHVEAAADAFGRKHMLGLGADEIEVLQRVRVHGTFVQTSDKDLALLVTRRVLEYQNGRARYAVHPTIAPLLEQLAVKP
jgi:hypothetical protein